MSLKRVNLKKISITIFTPFLIFSLLVKAKDIYSDNSNFPSDETITINMSEISQIPWDTVKAISHVVETFSAAVHGSLIPIEESNSDDEFRQNTLLKNYQCEKKTCYADLKKGIKFHNNREVTAYDIEFSLIKNILANKNNTFMSSILDDLENIEDLKNAEIVTKEINSIHYPTNLFKGIEVVDKYRIIFHLKRNNNFFFQKISVGRIPIVPIEEFDPSYKNWKKYPVGFGKYKVINADIEKHEFILRKSIKEEKIPKYVKLIFSKEDIGDVKILLGNQGRGNSGLDRKIIAPNIYINGGFLFNYKTELGANPRFRKAISLALDRKKIAAKSFFKEILPEDQMIPEFGEQKIFRANMPIQEQNVKKAKSLLNKVPHHLWKNVVFHVPTYWSNIKNINSLPYIEEIIKELKEIGIQTVFHDTDVNYDRFKENDKNVLWWTGFAFTTKDPHKNFAFFKKGSYFINESPNDQKFEKLYKESSQNMSKNSFCTKKLSEYFTKKNIAVIILNQRMSFAYNAERISSLGEQHNGIMFSIWKMKLRD